MGRTRAGVTRPAFPLVQVQPARLTGRRGVRRSFWGARPQGLAAVVPRQKVRWQALYMCVAPPGGPAVATMTEPRGAAKREDRTRLVVIVTTGPRKAGLLRVRPLTILAIYVFGAAPTLQPRRAQRLLLNPLKDGQDVAASRWRGELSGPFLPPRCQPNFTAAAPDFHTSQNPTHLTFPHLF